MPARGRCRGSGGGLVPRHTRSGPAMGLSLGGPSGVGLWLLALPWVACVDPITDASGFPVPSVLRPGTRPLHQGCFVWTPTPPLSGRRTPRPGPVRVCLCVALSARSGRRASRARFDAPHFFLWPVPVLSLYARPPTGWGCSVGGCSRVLFSFVRPCWLWRSVFRGVPALSALGLGVLRPRPPCYFSLSLSFFSFPPPRPSFFCILLFFLCSSSGFFFLSSFFLLRCAVSSVLGWSWASGRVGVCSCGCCASAGRLRFRCVVRCSLPVSALCVSLLVALRVSSGAVLAVCPFPVLLLLPCLCGLSSRRVLWRRLRPVVALGFCRGVALLRRVLSCCFALRWCVLCWSLWCGVLPRCGVPCGVAAPPLPGAVRGSFILVCAGFAPPPPPRLVVVPCVVRCRASYRGVLQSVVCFVFCPVLCGVLVWGWVLAPCCPAQCCAGSCCAVFVVLCCRALLPFLLVFVLRCSLPLRGAPGSFCLCGALPWCVALFGVTSGFFLSLCVVFWCLLFGLAVLFCLLVGPGGSWCRVLVVCCGVSLGPVLRCVAVRLAARRCVVVRCVVLFCSVWCCCALSPVLGRCPSSWSPVPSGAVFCLVCPRCVCFAVVCCGLLLFAAVLCAVCVLGCHAVRSLSSPPCVVLLCRSALPGCPAPLCCALWCCAVVWCCGVLSCCLVWFVSCVGLVYPT